MVDRVIEDVAVAIEGLRILQRLGDTIRRDEPPQVGVVITGTIVRQLARWRSGMRSTGVWLVR